MGKKITIGFSPCPNDTFIFDAMVHQRIDTLGLDFEFFLKDVEELNQIASRGAAQLIKVSCAHLQELIHEYIILTAGGALGFNCGPLIITRDLPDTSFLSNATVAVPGIHTTANFLLERFFPEISHKKVVLFSAIEDAILHGEVDAGVIIHESRFTYGKKGLRLLSDPGALWHQQTSLPLPLGCIVAHRSLPTTIIKTINRVLTDSVRHAFSVPADSETFIKQHASETEEEVVRQHIKLYVNELSLNLGSTGKEAIRRMLPAMPGLTFPLFADEL
jgi:1,4-dihydroxy-6-naphthoate synthase